MGSRARRRRLAWRSQSWANAADPGQLQGSGVGQEAEQAAGFDRAELGVVADQDQLGLRLGHQLREAREVAAGHHAGLVDHHHLPADQPPPLTGAAGAVVFEQQLGHRLGWGAGFGLQDPGRHRRHGQAPHGDAAGLPRSGGGAHAAGLAGPGRADHADDRVAVLGHGPHRRRLVAAQACLGDGRFHGGGLRDTPAARVRGRVVQDLLFDAEGVEGGEAGDAVTFEHRQAVTPPQIGRRGRLGRGQTHHRWVGQHVVRGGLDPPTGRLGVAQIGRGEAGGGAHHITAGARSSYHSAGSSCRPHPGATTHPRRSSSRLPTPSASEPPSRYSSTSYSATRPT